MFKKHSFLKLYYVLFILIMCSFQIFSQSKEYKTDDVVVTAGRTAISFSDLNRDVTVIYADEIKNTAVRSVQDLLQYTSGVDLKQRGIDGVQADVSSRGGTFEQTLILINGIKIREDNGDLNASGGTIIYMAFAEQPFVTSSGVPATAR